MKQYGNWIKICLLLGFLIVSQGCNNLFPKSNIKPEIPTISLSTNNVYPEETISLEAMSADADGDPLDYLWQADAGTFNTTRGSSITWEAPKEVGTYDISVEVSDGRSRETGIIFVQVISRDTQRFDAGITFTATGNGTYINFVEDTLVVPYVENIIIEIVPLSLLPASVPYGEVIVTIDISPDGLSFTPPVEVNFELPKEGKENFPGEVLDVLFFDEHNQVWVPAGEASVQADGKFATGYINHTSLWALVKRTTAVTPTPNLAPPPPPIVSPGYEIVCYVQPPFGWNIYLVQPDDTFYSLARYTSTTVTMIQQVNCLGSILPAYKHIWLPAFDEPPQGVTNTPTLSPTPTWTATPTETPTATPTTTPTPLPLELVDLIAGMEVFNIDVNCPGGAGTCVTDVNFDILNQDYGSFSGTSNVMVLMDPGQNVVVYHTLHQISPFETQFFTVSSPPGGNCYDPDCTVCIIVDSNDAAVESNESNNQSCRTFGG